jgi:hypothetical protein
LWELFFLALYSPKVFRKQEKAKGRGEERQRKKNLTHTGRSLPYLV